MCFILEPCFEQTMVTHFREDMIWDKTKGCFSGMTTCTLKALVNFLSECFSGFILKITLIMAVIEINHLDFQASFFRFNFAILMDIVNLKSILNSGKIL